MSQQLETLLNHRYEVRSPEACTVTDAADTLILTVSPGTPAYFIADGHPVTLSADSATMLPANARVVEPGASGGASLSATGEPVLPVSAPELTVRHATWFDNSLQNAITVLPAAWKNEVMTCYLKTAVPVTLSGVNWIYGAPVMVEDYMYVIALQQVDAVTVLANLAYTIPQ